MDAVAYFVWDASPVIVSWGPFALRWYGVLFALGFILGYQLMQRVYTLEGKPVADLEGLLLFLVAGTVVGARLGHVLFYDPGYYLSHPLQIVQVWKGGLASHGGALGVFVALWLYARRHPDQPFLWLVDRLAAPAALAGSLIRVGNLFNSEILGIPSNAPWAVIFARIDAVPRHPAQLYEAVCYALIFVLLWGVYRRLRPAVPQGLLVGLYLMLVFSARFLIEFVKVRQAAFGEALPLSMGQLLSIPMVLIGAWLVWRAIISGRRAQPGPGETDDLS